MPAGKKPYRKSPDGERIKNAHYVVDGARLAAAPIAPGLYVVATPIGNLRDVTLRALETLAAADLILAEDTRLTRRLLSHFAIKTPAKAFHEHNEEREQDAIMARLAEGGRIALVSDAGTPLISDPGFKLVRQAAASGIAVVPIPGASASLAALVASALPSDRFFFEGFLPARQMARRLRLEQLAAVPATLLFFESPRRLAACLADMAKVLGPRDAAVLRELTKLHEEAQRGGLPELAAHYADAGAPRGEVVIAVAQGAGPQPASQADLDAVLADLLTSLSVRDAAQEAARATGVSRGTAYKRALELHQRMQGGEGQ